MRPGCSTTTRSAGTIGEALAGGWARPDGRVVVTHLGVGHRGPRVRGRDPRQCDPRRPRDGSAALKSTRPAPRRRRRSPSRDRPVAEHAVTTLTLELRWLTCCSASMWAATARRARSRRRSSVAEAPADDPASSPVALRLRQPDPLESGRLEHRDRARIRRLRVDRSDLGIGVDRVGLEGGRAVVARVVDRSREELAGDPTCARVAPDEEAHERPDRDVIDAPEVPRAFEPDELLARPEAGPADRLAIRVSEQARCRLAIGDVPQRGPVGGRRSSRPSPTRDAGSTCTSSRHRRRSSRTAPRGPASGHCVSGTISRGGYGSAGGRGFRAIGPQARAGAAIESADSGTEATCRPPTATSNV